MEHILKYFPELTDVQRNQLAQLETLYPEWNAKINVISRKDIENLEVNHILHSLGLVRFVKFTPGTRVMDLGTGGGFPGIPLAVYYPDVSFHLVDRIGKKLKVAQDIAERIGLTNVTFQHGDVKEVKGKFDFVVSRAVMDLGDMVPLVKRYIDSEDRNAVPNGLLCLKGGDLSDEISKGESYFDFFFLTFFFRFWLPKMSSSYSSESSFALSRPTYSILTMHQMPPIRSFSLCTTRSEGTSNGSIFRFVNRATYLSSRSSNTTVILSMMVYCPFSLILDFTYSLWSGRT